MTWLWKTRTTRTPEFWFIPRCPWLPILVNHIRSQVKTRQSQSYKFWKNAKNSFFLNLQETLHATHLLKLLDKMYEYEMDPTRTVGPTEQTRDAGRMDGRTDRRTDIRTEWNQYAPPQQPGCITKQSQIHKLKKIAKFSNFDIQQETLHMTHLLKVLNKMYKYEINPTRTVGTTKHTWDVGWIDRYQTDGRRDRRMDRVKPINPPTISLCRGYNKHS